MGMWLGLQVFGHKPKYWTNKMYDLLMALDEMLGGSQSYYSSSQGRREYLYQILWQFIQ